MGEQRWEGQVGSREEMRSNLQRFLSDIYMKCEFRLVAIIAQASLCDLSPPCLDVGGLFCSQM